MAEPTQLTQYIESYVDASRSLSQQAASLDAIVLLLKNDAVTIGSLVKEMEMYLTTTDDIIRARGILLLGEALSHLSSKPLDNTTIHSLIAFFTERLADWRALRGALVGCLALIRRRSNGIITGIDAKVVAESYLQNLQVQSLAQYDRKLCFELLECLLENCPAAVASLGEDLIYGICEAIDGEKDPQCLMLTFHIVEVLGKLFPDPSGPFSSFAGDIFSILGCYFPIHFTHPKAEDVDVKRDDLSRALMLAFSSTPLFEPFAMPLLLEKLSSSLPTAKVDSLKYLSYCTLKFRADRIAEHAGAIWSSLKDAIYSSGEEPMLSSDLESVDSPGSEKNEIATEALLLLENLIVQNNNFFLSMIISDEEVKMIFNTITSYKSYNEISLQSKQKLHMVGRILYVCAKVSVSSCNRIFESYFPRLMEALGILVENTSGACHSNENCVKAKQPNYGSFYLSIKLLGACRDLSTSSDNLASQCISTNETYCCLLQRFSTSLTETFSAALATSTSGPAQDVDMYLGVKGLQILATFPGGYLFLSKLTFDNILMTFLSIITVDFNKTLLWNQALKALVQIGSFVHGCNESDKEMSYVDIVVGKMILLASSPDFSMPWSLKLTAISSIGMSGQKYMLKVFLGLEEAIRANLAEIYVQGNLKSAKILLQLLECYSDELLPWIQKTEGFEEVLMQFVVNLWNQIENFNAFTVAFHGKESLLDAIMKVMKDAVAFCSVESQNVIIYKAYGVLSSSTFLPLKESLSENSVQLECFRAIQQMDRLSSRDEWIHSLFASVIIALRPQTHIPNTRIVLHLFITALLKGHVTTAEALGSLVNKLDQKSNDACISGDCTIEEAMDIIFSINLLCSFGNGSSGRFDRTRNGDEMDLIKLCLDAPNLAWIKIPAIVGLAWIGKGLLMRGHEKVKDITMVFLNCLLSDGEIGASPLKHGSLENNGEQDMQQSVMKSASDAFQILMSDSELCLNRKYHAIVRPLYKQRFFSSIMPILYPLITKSDSSFSKSLLYRAFAHVISDTPLSVISNDAKKLVPVLLDGLTLLGKDVLDKDIMYGLLLVLSGILTDTNGKEAVIENAHIIIKCLIELVAYPHMMLIRETAVQCLVAMSELPHTRIYPVRIQVLQAISKALDDPKRAVRQEAVRCRQAWASIASRSLHY
ncbi:MMS19 nucleotide excision repair protein homolog isoform X1 [Ricinus communis]|uniref:MMS19 nucleotide excision repair protein homolog isoform X1 n=2 Tax=Ricinus communis TaxID=3988 RepID=UPI000772A277|nr:MMS19 nucleotide excision repair protein homolog isoform X1 [Ricinus communis]|eukprot:XP_015572860.1 MMS19 nucleotide excision repair protein homolog [Ricinus communis]